MAVAEFWHTAEVLEEIGDPVFAVTADTIVVAWRIRLGERLS
jgi:hypothetical protein